MTTASFPIDAFVVAVITSTVPPIATPAVPATAALAPTAAMSSLFVAVTATPWNAGFVPGTMSRGPNADASPAGSSPCLTRECDLPVTPAFVIGMKLFAVASSFVAASLNAPLVLPMT